MEDRRTKGATCVVARLGGPRGEVCGSLELSWHEFISCDVDAPLEPETVGERSAVVGGPVNDSQRDARTDSRSLAVFRPHGARLYITELCVAPFAQRRGVGLALLRASEDLVCRSYRQPTPALPPGAAAAPTNSARDVGIFQRRRDKVADWLKQRVQPRANVGAEIEAAFAAPQAALPAARVARPAEAESGRGSAATSLLSPALYLHVDGANRGALALYARAGFEVMFDGSTVVKRSSPEASAASASSAMQRAACGRFAQNLGLLSGELAKINHVLMVHAAHSRVRDVAA
jgi:ribosomal protein S18 acetylase RimI-like enzyme